MRIARNAATFCSVGIALILFAGCSEADRVESNIEANQLPTSITGIVFEDADGDHWVCTLLPTGSPPECEESIRIVGDSGIESIWRGAAEYDRLLSSFTIVEDDGARWTDFRTTVFGTMIDGELHASRIQA